MSMLIQLLDRKTVLINELKAYNDKFEKNRSAMTENFMQEYGWTGIQINSIDDALRHVVAKFRLRGLDNYNDIGQITQNFDKILQTPLTYIERQLEQATDPNQKITLQYIKNMTN